MCSDEVPGLCSRCQQTEDGFTQEVVALMTKRDRDIKVGQLRET